MEPTITFAIAGDVMLRRPVDAAITALGFAYPWGDILAAREQAACS